MKPNRRNLRKEPISELIKGVGSRVFVCFINTTIQEVYIEHLVRENQMFRSFVNEKTDVASRLSPVARSVELRRKAVPYRALEIRFAVIVASIFGLVAACGPSKPPPQSLPDSDTAVAIPEYIIGPLDEVQIHVAGVPELSVTVPVRPDGRISTPLVQDLPAAGSTPGQLALNLERALQPFVQDPDVSVVVQQFADTSAYTVRVMGAVATPNPVPYRPNMTVLDAMIAAGGLGEFAAGNDAVLIRKDPEEGEQVYQLRIDDLLVGADLSANAPVLPGDVIIVPEGLL